MSKQTYITRYLLIIKRLQRGPASFEQIKSYLALESEIRGLDFTLEKRTFQRELHEIRALFGVEIQYNRKSGAYVIAETYSLNGEQSSRLLEAYEMLELLQVGSKQAQNLYFEKRRPKGLQHFHGLLHAINNEKAISIVYQKFHEDEPCTRTLHPLALKESRGRWYLIAKDPYDEYIKSYGLDRIQEMDILKECFKREVQDIGALYEAAFGIIRSEAPQRIVLSFEALQGMYIKTYPLHDSQKEVKSDSASYTFALYMDITHDFIMELLSMGPNVRVLQPQSLAKQLSEMHYKAWLQYETLEQNSIVTP